MTNAEMEAGLSKLFADWCGQAPLLILPLAPSGSDRVYFRLKAGDKSAVGTHTPHPQEYQAFLYFSRHFRVKGIPVPEIYRADDEQQLYIQEDLGATTLYSYLLQKGDYFPDYLVRIYRKVVEELARMQIRGSEGLNFNYCFPRKRFDKQSMFWDFNYFKYHFLLPSPGHYDEAALEDDFHHLADYLQQADQAYFMFRDFQSRNIMIKGGEPYFIDYQGGRKGALQYDLASLLFQSKANIPADIRAELLGYYLDKVEEFTDIDRSAFTQLYYGFVLMRCIQVLGAYGYRGIYERKEHFLKSIPFALRNIKWIQDSVDLPVQLPELYRCLTEIIDSKRYEPFDRIKGGSSLLTVSVNSFSYKKGGIPEDHSGNGGGFVFDCRFVHNPGRYEPYEKLTGRDEAVINFLRQHSQMPAYLDNVIRIVDAAVEDFIDRSFTHLQVNFGCTGGQHRSVYAADVLAQHLKQKYGVRVELQHIEQEKKQWKNE